MTTPPDNDQATVAQRPRGIIAELKRRKVFRVLAAYAVVAWLILQIVAILSEAFPVPDWTVAFTIVALIIGFPIAAALSWAFQLTPQGLVLDIQHAERVPVDRSRLIHFIDVVIIAALLVVVAFLYLSRVETGGDEIPIAVLPFENLGDNRDADYLSDGIVDDIRARLDGLAQLRIAARSSSKSLYNKGLDIQTIGKRLNVDHVLEGSFLQVGDRIRVTAQLVDVVSGFNRWSKTYDTRFNDVLEMQNNISLVVASELQVLLSKETRRALAQNPTDDPRAFDYFMRANDYLLRPRTAENLDLAATLFQRAIDVDRNFALGYAGLCRTDVARYMHSGDTHFVDQAEARCNTALALNSSIAAVHTALGEMYLWMGRIDDAESSFRKAIDIDPQNTEAFRGMGDVFAQQGRPIEAEARYRAAIEIVPSNWISYNKLALFLFQNGRNLEAIDNWLKVIDLTPDNANAYNNVGAAYYMLGDFDSAARYFRSSLAITPGRAAYSNTGTMYYLAGNYPEAAAMFELAVSEADKDHRLWGNLADAQRFLAGGMTIATQSYQIAIGLAREQLDTSGEDPAVLTNLAWYLVNTAQPDAAREHLRRAEALAGRDAEQFYVAGLTYTLLGDADNAKQAILNALQAGFPKSILDATPELRGRND